MDKGYKGIGMEGSIARWYATSTAKDQQRIEEQARHVMQRAQKGARILEVAPGPGYLSITLARTGDYTVTGLDVSQTFVRIAREKAAEAGAEVRFRRGNAANMPFSAGTFDFIVCCAAFKNFSNPLGALQEMHRVLRPGGSALIVDLRRDVSKAAIEQDVARMELGPLRSAMIRMTLATFLPRRAYTRTQFQDFIARTEFRSFDINESPMSLEVELHR